MAAQLPIFGPPARWSKTQGKHHQEPGPKSIPLSMYNFRAGCRSRDSLRDSSILWSDFWLMAQRDGKAIFSPAPVEPKVK